MSGLVSNIPTTGATVAGMASPNVKKANRINKPATRNHKFSFWAVGPEGRFMVTGRNAQTLNALVAAGDRGIITVELSNTWALRLGAYIHQLRHDYGLHIETIREEHDGGFHGRYFLKTPVVLLGGAS